MGQILLHHIPQLISCVPLAESHMPNPTSIADLGILKDAWIAADHGKIVEVGTGTPSESYRNYRQVKCSGKLVLPGLIDSHTHLIFAGDRSLEFCQRASGKSYQEIAQSGGGIQSTVQSTAFATDTKLIELAQSRLLQMRSFGTTTVEAKSGYGLSVEQELRILRLYKLLKKTSPQELYITCLALHAVPKNKTKSDYIHEVQTILLANCKNEKLAQAFDAFVEDGYYQVEDLEEIVKTAIHYGLEIRIHADEFSDAGAASAAARWNCKSADHLQFANQKGIEAMAKSNVVATILPATSFYTNIPYTDAQRFINSGVRVSLASDFNPGSAKILNLGLVMGLACLHNKMSPEQCIAATTYNAATSLGMQKRKGVIASGYAMDLAIYEQTNIYELVADMGQTPPLEVWINGESHTL